ncbi:NAD(P)H-dependent oxidoreductase [Qipengyuania sp. SM2507]
MTIRKILIIDGHPDPSPDRFVHALAEAYAEGAEAHEVRRLKLGELDIPFVRSAEEWTKGEPSAAIASAQSDIVWAEHIVVLYPLWLGDVPTLFYKLVYGAHSVKSLERNILKFVGIRRIERMILGSVEADEDRRRQWLDEMRALGAGGA